MGSNERDDEGPIHDVEVDGFWMARYPVTNAQHRLFVEAAGYRERRWWSDEGWGWVQQKDISKPRYWSESKWNGERQPVVGASWYEAMAFCRWAAETAGAPIRLPSEAEWEKAARGTDGRRYPWGGEAPTEKHCNFGGSVGKTTSVGWYSPDGDSPYGCADMAGNVWEWTDSWYQAYPGNESANDDFGEKYRVVRGGSWDGSAGSVRTSCRVKFVPEDRGNLLGFRCASKSF